MKASSDKRRGATHLEQLVSRNPGIGDDSPVTLELLSKHCKIEFEDLCTIYNKHSEIQYPRLPEATALDTLASLSTVLQDELKNGNIKVMSDDEVVKFIENAPKKNSDIVLPGKKEGVKYKIPKFSTKNKTLLEGIEVVSDDLPVEKPELVRQVGIHKLTDPREFNEKALLKVYEFVNRLERFKLGKIKTIPPPKKISSKYIELPKP